MNKDTTRSNVDEALDVLAERHQGDRTMATQEAIITFAQMVGWSAYKDDSVQAIIGRALRPIPEDDNGPSFERCRCGRIPHDPETCPKSLPISLRLARTDVFSLHAKLLHSINEVAALRSTMRAPGIAQAREPVRPVGCDLEPLTEEQLAEIEVRAQAFPIKLYEFHGESKREVAEHLAKEVRAWLANERPLLVTMLGKYSIRVSADPYEAKATAGAIVATLVQDRDCLLSALDYERARYADLKLRIESVARYEAEKNAEVREAIGAAPDKTTLYEVERVLRERDEKTVSLEQERDLWKRRYGVLFDTKTVAERTAAEEASRWLEAERIKRVWLEAELAETRSASSAAVQEGLAADAALAWDHTPAERGAT